MAKAKMTTEDLLGVFEEMSVLELSEFLKAFEEKFDVTAAAPMAMAVAAPGAGAGEAAAAEEQTGRAQEQRQIRAVRPAPVGAARAGHDGGRSSCPQPRRSR